MAKMFRTRKLLHCNRSQSKQFLWVCYRCKEKHNSQRGQTNYNKKNSNGQALEIIGVNLEKPITGDLWLINV